jgi:hypothetical protein
MNLNESTNEQKIYTEVAELLCKDGWQKLTREIDKCYVFVFKNDGEIVHRYLEWDWDHSEWHNATFWYPEFWFSNRCNVFEDVDDSTQAIVVCTSIPEVTDYTKKAHKILEEYWNSFCTT